MAKYDYKTTHTAKTDYNLKSSYLRPKTTTKICLNFKKLELNETTAYNSYNYLDKF